MTDTTTSLTTITTTTTAITSPLNSVHSHFTPTAPSASLVEASSSSTDAAFTKTSPVDFANEAKSCREAIHLVDIFDGTSPSVDSFIHQITSLFDSTDLNESIFVRLLITQRLTGRARDAFDKGVDVTTLDQFIATLRLAFKSTSFELLKNQRSRMFQRKESLAAYTERFKKLQREIILSILNNPKFTPDFKTGLIAYEEAENVTQYIIGLPERIRERIHILRPPSIHDAHELAQQANDDLNKYRAIDAMRGAQLKGNFSTNSQSGKISSTQNQQRAPFSFAPRRNNFPSQPTHQQRQSNSNTLPRPPDNKNYKPAPRCFTCNGPHHQSQCPTLDTIKHIPTDVEETTPIPTLEEVLFFPGNDDEVLLTLSLPSGPCCFIVDTGARINLIKSSAAVGCETKDCVSYFTGIGGGVVRTDRKATWNNHEFFIVPDDFPLKFDGLLGRSYLRQSRTKLDFNSADVVGHVTEQTNDPESRETLLLNNTRLSHLDPATRDSIWNIEKEYADIFCLPGDSLPATDLIEHKIETTDEIPVQVKQYRHPPGHKDEIAKQTAQMLKQDIITESKSPYNSPLLVVPKKDDASGQKKHRVVVDFRQLNNKTPKDNYPLPNIEDIFDQLGKARYFSAFDLASGFHQIKLDPKTRHKTAFSTPHGHFEYKRLAFGLKNAPPSFQRMMDRALVGLLGNGIFVYLDDIIVCGKTLEEHNENLRKLFQRLREVGLKLQPDKCEFLAPELAYLGHVITPNGIKPNPFKIQAVSCFPQPTNTKQVKQFLGLAGYYRKFIKDFSKIARPLNQLLIKNRVFIFTTECRVAFETLRTILCSSDVLMFPDFSKPFYLTSDASDFAIGGVLEQLDDKNQRRPVAYASRTLNSAEQNYSTIEKELLAIVWLVKHYRPYLYGRKFIIRTDHQPLVWLFNLKDPSSRLMRWRIKLEEYDYVIEYLKGTLNSTADALSRNPVLLVRWKHHITERALPSATAIPVYFSRRQETKFKVIRSPEDDSLLAMRLSLDDITIDSLRDMFENVIQLLISEEKNLVYIEYDKLLQNANLPANTINSLIKTIFIDPLIVVELGTQPLLTAHTNDEKSKVIEDYHNSLQAGHQGVTKTLQMMLQRYYWRGIQKDVHDYIVKCPTCQVAKHDRIDRKAPRAIVQTPSRRNEKIALDIVGPLPASKTGNIYILTLQDCLTKYVQAYPLPNQTTNAILDQLIKKYIPACGIPKSILTDQGRNFVSELNSEFCDLFKIKHIKCSPFHPESNGSLERLHCNLKEFLKANAPAISDWDQILPYFILYYNSSIQTSTGYSPFELTFSEPPFQLSDLTDNHGKTYSDYLSDVRKRFDFVWNQAKTKDLRIKIKLTDKFNATRKAPNYTVRQQILLRADESRQLGKGIRNPFEGPYSITKIISEQNVQINRNGSLETVHVNRIRPFNN